MARAFGVEGGLRGGRCRRDWKGKQTRHTVWQEIARTVRLLVELSVSHMRQEKKEEEGKSFPDIVIVVSKLAWYTLGFLVVQALLTDHKLCR